MSQTTAPQKKPVRLPVIDPPADVHLPRPTFGSPEVASYGAVGLDIRLPDNAAGRANAMAPERQGDRDVYRVSQIEPLPLAGSLAHHAVDGVHLWIGVEDGLLVVLDDTEQIIMEHLRAAQSPAQVAAALVHEGVTTDEPRAWELVAPLIGRLAAAGFIRGIRGHHTVRSPRPHRFGRFHLTQRCQLECAHCYTESSPHLPRDGELSTERWIQLIDDFADNGGERALFTGGEALVHPGCINIMRRAHERGLHVTLFSNGILVPRHLDALKECCDVIQISIDGPDDESHDRIRGPGSFRKAVRALRALLDETDIEVRISTTVMVENWRAIRQSLPDFVSQFAGTRLTYRVSYGAMSHGRGEDLDKDLDTNETRQWVDDLLARAGHDTNPQAGRNAVQKISGCGYAEQLVVDPRGIVYPCHLLSGPLGHVDDLPLRDITRYLSRTAEAFSVDNRKGCGTCDLRNLCGGSCRVEDEKHTGSRLVTTCTPEEKLRKKRFLARRYRAAETG